MDNSKIVQEIEIIRTAMMTKRIPNESLHDYDKRAELQQAVVVGAGLKLLESFLQNINDIASRLDTSG